MKKVAAIVAAAVLIPMMLAGGVQAVGMAKSGFMERTMTVTNTGASNTGTARVYWKGDKMRLEQHTIAGMIVQIKNGRTVYMYDPAKKTAMKMVMPQTAVKSVQQILQEMTGMVKGGKKVGTTKVAGFQCDVYSVPVPGSKGHSVKIYASTDPRLPLPLKMQIAAGSRRETMETRVVKLDYNVPDKMFRLPAGTKVEEQKTPSMPKGHPPVGR